MFVYNCLNTQSSIVVFICLALVRIQLKKMFIKTSFLLHKLRRLSNKFVLILFRSTLTRIHRKFSAINIRCTPHYLYFLSNNPGAIVNLFLLIFFFKKLVRAKKKLKRCTESLLYYVAHRISFASTVIGLF